MVLSETPLQSYEKDLNGHRFRRKKMIIRNESG